MTNYVAVLTTNYVGKEWSIGNNDYDTLEWLSDGAKPTKSTLDGMWVSVQQKIADEATAKEAVKASVIAKLGLTADEVKALLS